MSRLEERYNFQDECGFPISFGRVCVSGGRDFTNGAFFYQKMDQLLSEFGFRCVIHGDAKGADRLADIWGRHRGLRVVPFPADWNRYGESAGILRNRDMLTIGYPELVIAFPTGGPGTRHMIQISIDSGTPTIVWNEHGTDCNP